MPKILTLLVLVGVGQFAVASAAPPRDLPPVPPSATEIQPAEIQYDEAEFGDEGAQFDLPDSCPPVYYIEGDYLSWWVQGDDTPPLVTTSTPGTPRIQAGRIGQPNTSVLFGDGDMEDEARSGARIVLGRWLTTYARLEAEWFDLGEVESQFSESSDGTPILARPFFNVTTGVQDAFLVAYPGVRVGEVSASSSSRLWGAGIAIVEDWDCGHDVGDAQMSLSFGLRYLRLAEGISVNDRLTSIEAGGPVPVGTMFTTSDRFDAINDFFGFNFGVRSEWQRECWSFSCLGNVGVGQTVRNVKIAGNSSTTTPAGAVTNFNGGLLALPTNIGDYESTQLGIVPQVQFKVGYDITCNTRIILAYDAMYWTSVVRAGDQIDTSLNTSQASGQPLVGQAAPTFSFRESGLWVQGVSIGAEWRF